MKQKALNLIEKYQKKDVHLQKTENYKWSKINTTIL